MHQGRTDATDGYACSYHAADTEEDQGTTIQLSDRSVDLEHVLRCDSYTVGDHDQAVDEEECRGVIEQDI